MELSQEQFDLYEGTWRRTIRKSTPYEGNGNYIMVWNITIILCYAEQLSPRTGMGSSSQVFVSNLIEI